LRIFQVFFLLLLLARVTYAGEADVTAVEVEQMGANLYRFEVTVLHDDAGWKHYADKWDVVAPDGEVFGSRTLGHPHVHEQPFTRSLSGVKISEEIQRVTIRARCSVHGAGGKVVTVDLPR